MPLVDFDKVFKEYEHLKDDFGFSAVSEKEYNETIDKTASKVATQAVAQTTDTYKKRLADVERIIIPFLQKMHESGDKEYIYWPNRKPVIEQQIEKILKLTRD